MIASVQLLSVVEQLMSGKEVEIEGRSFKVTRTKLGGTGGELCCAARDWTAEGGCPYVGCGCRGQGWQATRGKVEAGKSAVLAS